MDGAEVIVPFASTMQQGDRIVLTWDCTEDAGDYTDEKVVDGGTGDISFTVPYDVIAEGIDGTVTVSYELLRGDVVIGAGAAMAFVIRQSELPAVVMVEANGSNLDPDDVPAQGASAEIAATAVFALDDVVTLHWTGVTDYETSHTIGAADVGKSIRMMVPKATVEASNGTVISVHYTILRKANGDTETSPTATYDVGRELARGDLLVLGARNGSTGYHGLRSPRYLRALSAATRQDIVVEWRYEGNLTSMTGTSFYDSEPWRLLHVRTADASTSILPVHLAGAGITTGVNPKGAFGALLKSSRPYAWGDRSYGANIPAPILEMDGFVEISTNQGSMAARMSNGLVVPWGAFGGDISPLPVNVQRVAGGSLAFAAIHNQGALLAWGTAYAGGTLSTEAKQVHDAQSITPSSRAFCCRRSDGRLVTWGFAASGGYLPPTYAAESFISVRGTYGAFCALRSNGSLVAWGDAEYGGTLSQEAAAAYDIAELASATGQAFAVRTASNRVIAWGPSTHGGVLPDVVKHLTDVVEVVSTWGAFCARRAGGEAICWGDQDRGGKMPPQYAVEEFIQVVGTEGAFAGLKRDGTVLAWGDLEMGGNASPVSGQLVNIRAIYASNGAFAAMRDSGGVVVWGAATAGGLLTQAEEIFLDENLRYEAEGSAVWAASPHGRALAIFRAKNLASIVA